MSTDKNNALLSIEDLLGAGKATDKIVNAIQAGVGALWRPVAIRLEGSAHRAEAQGWIKLYNKNNLPITSSETTLEDRAQFRINAEDMAKQANREVIAQRAIEEFRRISQTEEQTDVGTFWDDWELGKFWQQAEQITKPEMQDLFARILAQSVVRNQTYNARLFQALDIMDSKEFETVERLGPLFVQFNNSNDEIDCVSLQTVKVGERRLEGADLHKLMGNRSHDILGPIGVYVEDGWAYSSSPKVEDNHYKLNLGKYQIEGMSSPPKLVGTRVTRLGIGLTSLLAESPHSRELAEKIAGFLKKTDNSVHVKKL